MDTLLSLSILISCVLSQGTEFEASWTDGGTIESRTIAETVVFNYNTKIFILGGWNDPKALYECDITNSPLSCTDKGTTILNEDIRTYTQSYTQIGNLGYALGDTDFNAGTSLYVYTLSDTGPLLSKTITIPKDVEGNKACLTNTNDKLFIIGGVDPAGGTYDRLRTLQIYNLPNGPWETTAPDMKLRRERHACAAVGDYLYAIGGYSWEYETLESNDIEKIERIQITNILNNFWQYTSYDLLDTILGVGFNSIRAIVIDHYIITIGGFVTDNGPIPKAQAIQIINTNDNTINAIKYGGSFITSSYSNGVIHVGNTIYAFGGWYMVGNNIIPFNTLQYLQLATDAPTSDPTEVPTNNPTPSPTNNPTPSPTNVPTASPTPSPTNDPTPSPTDVPTNNPTTYIPTTNNPTTTTPTTSPTTTIPTTTIPTTNNPTTYIPTTNNPTTTTPTTTSPTTAIPRTNNPTTYISTTNNPTTATPTTTSPTTAIATTNSPITRNPTGLITTRVVKQKVNNQSLLSHWPYVLITLVIMIVVIIFAVLYCFKKRKKDAMKSNSNDTNYLQLSDGSENAAL